MKVIIASDSHGNSDRLQNIFLTKIFDIFIFCGDGVNDFNFNCDEEKLCLVSGNCDFFSQIENDKIIEFFNEKVFITHGNRYGVKSSLNKLSNIAKTLGAKFVFYGHTHKQDVQKIDGIYFVNPGAICNGDYIEMNFEKNCEPIFEFNRI